MTLRSFAALAGFAFAMLATPADAFEPPTIVVTGDAQHPLVLRLRDELAAAGMRVVLVGPTDIDPRVSLSATPGAALVRVETSPPSARIWLRSTDDIDEAIVVVPRRTGEDGDRLLTLRAVEVLRGELMPVAPAPAARVAPIEPPPQLGAPPAGERPAEPAPATVGRPWIAALHAGPALLIASGGLSVAPQIRVGATFHATGRLAIDTYALAPTVGSSIEVAEGSVVVRALATGAGPSVSLTPPGDPFVASVHGGVGVAAVFVSGDADAPYRAETAGSAAFAPHVGLALSYWFADMVAVRLDAQAQLLLPVHGVRVSDRSVAEVGPGAGAFALSLEVRP